MPGALLLERDTELRRLASAFEAAAAGEGQTIVVEAPAGAGKSALVRAAATRAKDAGMRVLWARGSELESEFAFGAVRQLFETVLDSAPQAERERLLAGAAAPAARAVAEASDAPGAPSDGFATLHALYWLAANLAHDTPLLLVVDDAHWADASSLRALAYLGARTADARVALVVTMRPDEPRAPAELLDELRTKAAVYLTLGPLGRESVARLVRDRLPSADDAVCAACSAQTAGNPLYLQELLRTISSEGGLSNAHAVDAIEEASVPSLGARIVRRIARVSAAAPAIASAMAVLGDGGALSIAAALAGISTLEAGPVAHSLRRIEVLSREDPFAFVHPLVRRSVYDGMPVTERGVFHAAAAELLRSQGAPLEAVAAHMSAVTPRGSADVATTLVEAAESALARSAPDEAVRWFRRALEEGAPEPAPAAILAGLGLTQATLRDKEAIAHLDEALDRAEEPALRLRVAAALAEILFQAGQWERGMAVVAAGDDGPGNAHPELKAELAAIQAAAMAYDPALIADFDRERAHFTELAMGDGWGAHALAALLAAVAAHRGEGVARVLELAERALEGGRLLAERGSGGWASAQVLSALAVVDEYERALAVCEEVTAAARRDGSVIGLLTGLGYRGWIRARQGDLAAAEAELGSVLEAARQADFPMLTITGVSFLQDAILERPSLEDLAQLVETTELDPLFASTWSGALLLSARGRLRVARNDRNRGVEDLRISLAINRGLQIGPVASPARSTLALALPASEHDEASALAAEEVELARASGLARPQGVALRAAGLLEEIEPGIELLRESVRLLEGSGARLEHARSLVELGATLRRAGRAIEARTELAAGMEIADSCGAERLLTRARDELHAAGGRPRRIARTGVAALTASELRVAHMAAKGTSNSEIAQELFVSLKTVESHLYNAYAKLGLAGQGSRERLSDVLAG